MLGGGGFELRVSQLTHAEVRVMLVPNPSSKDLSGSIVALRNPVLVALGDYFTLAADAAM